MVIEPEVGAAATGSTEEAIAGRALPMTIAPAKTRANTFFNIYFILSYVIHQFARMKK